MLLDDTTAAYQAAYMLFSNGLLTEEVVKNPDAVSVPERESSR